MTSVLPLLNVLAAFLYIEEEKTPEAAEREDGKGRCTEARQNLVLAFKYLKLPSMYKPMIFIFLVVVAPGVTDAMFYYESNVLMFTPTDFGILGIIACLASIVGVWSYRIFFTKTPLVCYFLGITVLLSMATLSNLLIVNAESHNL